MGIKAELNEIGGLEQLVALERAPEMRREGESASVTKRSASTILKSITVLVLLRSTF
jgi:hypothetical protein